MIMSAYCKSIGMNINQYKQFKNNIEATAKAIRQQLTYKGGLYFSTNEILKSHDSIVGNFIIQELKKLGLEFRDNNNLYRVCD